MIITNNDIYNNYIYYYEAFQDTNIYFPVKVGFYLHKNMEKIEKAAEAIDAARRRIMRQYGILQDDGTYEIEDGVVDIVNKELQDLSEIEQDIDIIPISIKEFDKIELNAKQLNSIMFMLIE